MDERILLAREQGHPSLSEHDSKAFLSARGFPVTRGIVAAEPAEAVSAARALGFPLAVKASFPGLSHKTEVHALRLGVRSEDELLAAFDAVRTATRPDAPVLVEQMARGSRELAMGLFRDPHFGPCVMLGLGGVFAEALGDTAFRAAPVDRAEVADMVEELSGKKILKGVRGMKPVDPEALFTCIDVLCRVGLEEPDVAEVDANPVLADDEGNLVAADALVVLA
ncbi:MAG: acetate--CoA ligase family protein [Deltaproteobacteria bacterium]|nr:acetate--CoA ligase family protein [Deltaproteobacteria bacterium]